MKNTKNLKSLLELGSPEVAARIFPSQHQSAWIIDDPIESVLRIEGLDCSISIRPYSGLAGRWIAIAEPRHQRRNYKGWPRYFFSQEVAQHEVEAWLNFNGQFDQPTDNQNVNYG